MLSRRDVQAVETSAGSESFCGPCCRWSARWDNRRGEADRFRRVCAYSNPGTQPVALSASQAATAAAANMASAAARAMASSTPSSSK